jgi:hypothetical protein
MKIKPKKNALTLFDDRAMSAVAIVFSFQDVDIYAAASRITPHNLAELTVSVRLADLYLPLCCGDATRKLGADRVPTT